MDWITITGLKPHDGRYELDINQQPLTTREWGWAKRYAGYLPVNLDQDTFTDPEMIAVLAIVALWRNGKLDATDVPAIWDRLLDAPFGATVGWEAGPAGEQETDAGPPPPGTGSSSSSNGEDSRSDSETLVLPPRATGSLPSATSRSVPATSVS